MRLEPERAQRGTRPRVDWSYDGIVAYSKICTHVGCPVALYEQQTHHLLCPCHQSQFDVANHCEVIFGPAKRPLPQLPIAVDDEGYLIAQSDFTEPVGPSFWERQLSIAPYHRHVDSRARSRLRSRRAASNYIDERTSLAGFVKELGRKVFPDHWSFLLGEVALFSFVVILLSGTFLTFFFQASMAEVHYDGSYVPLKGVEMSAAMASTLDISFDIRGGLLRAPDAPLGRAAVRRLHRPAHAAHLLHGSVPQAA